MEAKDYWTIGIAVLALIVSIGAALAAWASYRLAVAQHRRTIEAEKPFVALTLPLFDGPGPWLLRVTVKNRDQVPIVLQSFRAEEGCPVTLSGYGRFPSVSVVGDLSLTPAWIHLSDQVEPGESMSFEINLILYQGRIGADVPAHFSLKYTRCGAVETPQRLDIRRIANPTMKSVKP